MRRAVVVGLGITGRAVAVALRSRNIEVRALDDRVTPEMQEWAAANDLHAESPAVDELAGILKGADAVLPAPGLPDHHPVFAAAADAGIEVLSELDLAHLWDDRPIVAITGTDGKTTVVTLVQRMLQASGREAVCVGNTDVPFVAAIDDPHTDVFVVEASSFRLGHSRLFAPDIGTWLNFGPDHLDSHATLERYESAKASIWTRLPSGGLAVANRDDPVVMAHARSLADLNRCDVETFGSTTDATHRIEDGTLVLAGQPVVAAADLRRGLPHDLLNGLAAGASALRAGACRRHIGDVLRGFSGLPHRVELVAEVGGVRFVNDSKATTPHATTAAIKAFDSIVLLAGGRNKGLALDEIGRDAGRIRHVVALGEATPEIQAVFAGLSPTSSASSMEEAIHTATDVARPGDVVLLSPACASFDWYRNYRERGDDFTRLVRIHAEGAAT